MKSFWFVPLPVIRKSFWFIAFLCCTTAHKKQKPGGKDIYWGEVVSGYDYVHQSTGLIPIGIPSIGNPIYPGFGNTLTGQHIRGSAGVSPIHFQQMGRSVIPNRSNPVPITSIPGNGGISRRPGSNFVSPSENLPIGGMSMHQGGLNVPINGQQDRWIPGGQHLFHQRPLPINRDRFLDTPGMILPRSNNLRIAGRMIPEYSIHLNRLNAGILPERPMPGPISGGGGLSQSHFPSMDIGSGRLPISGEQLPIGGEQLPIREDRMRILPRTNVPSNVKRILPFGQIPVQGGIIPPSVRLSQLRPGHGPLPIYPNEVWLRPLGINPNIAQPGPGESSSSFPNMEIGGHGGPMSNVIYPEIGVPHTRRNISPDFGGHLPPKGKKKKGKFY